MKVVALVSGGKDSCYNMLECVRQGHEIVALGNLHPPVGAPDELDSHMFQTVGHQLVDALAECMELPLYRQALHGKSLIRDMNYDPSKCGDGPEYDEIVDLEILLKNVLEHHPDIKGVSSGAVLSSYQRIRIEYVCSKLGLTSLAYLWKREQDDLLLEIVQKSNIIAYLVKVAAPGLSQDHLGKPINTIVNHLLAMSKKYGINSCGEGGEYESFTLDCPLFKKKIVIDAYIIHSDTGKDVSDINEHGEVLYYTPQTFHLENKTQNELLLDKSFLQPLYTHEEQTLDKQLTLTVTNTPCLSSDQTSGKYTFCHSRYTMWAKPLIDAEYSSLKLFSEVLQDTLPTSCQSVKLIHPCQSSRTFFLPSVRASITTHESLDKTSYELIKTIKETIKEPYFIPSHINLFVPSMKDFVPINIGYSKNFSTQPPSRACTECHPQSCWNLTTDLGSTSSDTSYVSVDTLYTNTKLIPRSVFHVQSLSHWSPANIGPYAQAVTSGSIVTYAGQIGLYPEDLSLSPSMNKQFTQMIRNIHAILGATNCSIQKGIANGSFFLSASILDFTNLKNFITILCNFYIHSELVKHNPLLSVMGRFLSKNIDEHGIYDTLQAFCLIIRYACIQKDQNYLNTKHSIEKHEEKEIHLVSNTITSHSNICFDKHGQMKVCFDEEEEEFDQHLENLILDPFDVSLLSLQYEKHYSISNVLSSTTLVPEDSMKLRQYPISQFNCDSVLSPYSPILYQVAPQLPKYSVCEFQTMGLTKNFVGLGELSSFYFTRPIIVNDTVVAISIYSGVVLLSKYISCSINILSTSHISFLEYTKPILHEILEDLNVLLERNQFTIPTNDQQDLPYDIIHSKFVYCEVHSPTFLQSTIKSLDIPLGYFRNTSFTPSSTMIFSIGESLRLIDFTSALDEKLHKKWAGYCDRTSLEDHIFKQKLDLFNIADKIKEKSALILDKVNEWKLDQSIVSLFQYNLVINSNED